MPQIEYFDILYRYIYTKSSVLPFFAFSRTHAHVYTHQNSNSTHYGNHSTLTKRFFQNFFLSHFFKFLIFGFSRNFLSSEMDYLHQTLAAGFTRALPSYVLSVFIRSFAFVCNLYFSTFATKHKSVIYTLFFLMLTKSVF